MADDVSLPGTGSTVATDDIGGRHFQRVKATWGVDGTATDVTATTPLPTSINASVFQFSTLNVTTSNLNAGDTYTGSIEDTRNQPMVSLLVTSDQPMLLTLQQFVDLPGTYPTKSIVRYISANQGLQESIPINGNYFRVVLQNVGSGATTNLNLNTAFGTIPSADSDGRSPVSLADGATLLLQTLTTATTSTVIDTSGYGSVAVQLSGNWVGSGYFEASNDYTSTAAWVPVLVLGSDPIGLQDMIYGDGLYSVNPSGRYLRFKLTNITGSCAINAVGRAGKANNGSDVLSLAMDRQNNTPLFTALDDPTRNALNTPKMDLIGRYSGFGVIPIGQLLIIDCTGYATLSIHSQVGTTGVVGLRWSNDGTTFSGNALTHDAGVGQSGPTMNAGMRIGTTSVMARYAQLYLATATTGTLPTFFYVYGSTAPVALPSLNIVNTVSTVATVNTINAFQSAATTNAFINSAATTNATSVKASAGNVYSITASNTGAAAAFVKYYNKASAPTVGTDVPVITFTIPIGGHISESFTDFGMRFSTGIALAITNLAADADATAVAAAQVKVITAYI